MYIVSGEPKPNQNVKVSSLPIPKDSALCAKQILRRAGQTRMLLYSGGTDISVGLNGHWPQSEALKLQSHTHSKLHGLTLKPTL